MSWYKTPADPLFEALRAITGKKPPDYVRGIYRGMELGDRVLELQDWCAENARPEWSTGLGVLEAAELIVQLAIENDNIRRRDDPRGADY